MEQSSGSILFVLELDLGATILGQQHSVAFLQGHRDQVPCLVARSRSNSYHLP